MKVLSVNISEKKGIVKKPVDKIELNSEGIVGDAHSGRWHRQISILANENIVEFAKEHGTIFEYGEFAENITTEGLNVADLSLLDNLQIGETLIEFTQRGKKCHGDDCAVYRKAGRCVMPKAGIFCRVINGGIIRSGDVVKVIKKPLKIDIITLSDRAFSGEYKDRSGIEIKNLLDAHFAESDFFAKFANILIPDDPEELTEKVEKSLASGTDIIFTTGGTGISERDITPDVIKPMLHREIPGIMEFIRTKYAEEIPSAMLSRSVAGIIDKTLIFTLPGSVKAVSEYTMEITKVINHAILSIKGIETHSTV